ncbi:MAG: hypothetical protein JWN70_4580 [Planctomycetaceae bacterium]|nr:hypothetical protein [Planctomycetaceae bacterium]
MGAPCESMLDVAAFARTWVERPSAHALASVATNTDGQECPSYGLMETGISMAIDTIATTIRPTRRRNRTLARAG